MRYSIQHINSIVQGQFLNKEIEPIDIIHLVFDSRQVFSYKSSLFFAIQGKRNDGHRYIASAYQSGLRNFVVSQQVDISNFPKANFINVANTLVALQQLAQYHREQFSLPTIGITGSNGKTIIKEWLFQLLQKDFNIVRSPKSYNSQIGVPLSVWQIQKNHNLGIFEAGISTANEMGKLSPIINCDIGIFTNIGTAHDEGFSSRSEKIQEKLKLFSNTKKIIYNKDDEGIHQHIQNLDTQKLFSWSKKSTADLQIIELKKVSLYQSKITGLFKNNKHSILIPFNDEASIENVIHCWALMLLMRYQQDTIQDRLQDLEAVAMRLELKAGINNCTIINDSYNSDINSLSIAINFLQQQSNTEKKTLILSDILQSGQDLKKLYQQVALLVSEKKITRFIGIGKDILQIKPFLDKSIEALFFDNTSVLLQNISTLSFERETVLLKGARRFTFEKIATRLEKKIHKTVLEINLSALIHNLNIYKSLVKPSTKMMVMVKAAAYGIGSYEVARLLESQQIDYLAVAYTDEGVELRKRGIHLPILVLNPEETSFDALARFSLEPEIYSFRLLKQLIDFTKYSSNTFPIHIKLETGMNRLGFEADDIEKLISLLTNNPLLQVRSIFSHLAASEDAKHDDFTSVQIDQFLKLYDLISKKIGYSPLGHLLNSSGIVRFSAQQLDMVRLGIGLYGIDSSDLLQNQLQTVHTLKATISQIRTISEDETVGYSRAGIANTTKKVATISIGYADGLMRAAGNGRFHMLLHGQLVPTIGNICMDMAMIDITQVEEAKEGDEVIIFGKTHAIQHLAKSLHTIPYEIFTNISERVKRVYYQE